ncbi:MAG TPA: patatin-like phospholipase family protein [Polyangiaceae bacterium]|nr:patatin-like phospholipase family protein [Polyangiaceae bacterium]
MPYNVLCLDGGGIKGVITAVLLQRLVQNAGGQGFLEHVHFVAGTSTGGLIALAIAAGKSVAEIRALYGTKGPEIFADSLLDDVKDVGKLLGADYSLTNLEKILKGILGEATTLGDLKKRVLLTTFDLDNESKVASERRWKPKLFHNFPGTDSDAAAAAYKVGLYTCAAPTYFPTADGYIDGGVFAPNPSMCALAQTQDRRTGVHVPLADVRLLSLGTGQSQLRLEGARHDWGYAAWAPPLLDILFDGVTGIADFQCEQMLREKYHRLAPVFPENVKFGMDDVDKVDDMIRFAERVDLTATSKWLATHWNT